MNSTVKAVIAVAIIVVAAVGGALSIESIGNDDAEIVIVDGAGKRIEISSPLDNVAVINKNIPKTMIMLGISDAIGCYYYTGSLSSDSFKLKCEELGKTEPDRNLGTYYTPSVETLVKYKIQAILCPVNSMTLYSNVEKQCNEVGIKVIRLNCNGESLLDDIRKISKIFGEPESAKEKITKYEEMRSDVIEAISDTISNDGGRKGVFLSAFSSKEAVYNHSSEISILLETIFASNITRQTDLDTKGVTNGINTGTIETITKVSDNIDVVILRGVNGKSTVSDHQKVYTDIKKTSLITDAMRAVEDDRVFVVNSTIMSGLYAHIGLLVILKEVCGLSVDGYSDINRVIYDFQDEFKQAEVADGKNLIIQFGKDHPTGINAVNYEEPVA